jgi:hypothetical protein
MSGAQLPPAGRGYRRGPCGVPAGSGPANAEDSVERDLSSTSWLDEPGGGAAGAADGADALLAGLARRICGHAERQLAVAERLGAGSTEGAEIAAGARRLLRDGESALSLVGGAPERRGPVPTGFGRILADVAAGAEDPRRVSVPPAPSAALPARVAVGAGQVLAELLAHAERTAPRSARIELVGRWAGDGGVTIELQAEGVELPWQQAAALENEIAGGASGPIPPERLGLHLAARLSRRLGARVELQAPLGGPTTPGYGTVALVRFPRALVEPAAGVAPPPVPEPRPENTWEPVREGAAPAPATVDELFGAIDATMARAREDMGGTPIFAAVASAWFRTDDEPAPVNGHTNGHVNGTNGHRNGSSYGLADSWLTGGAAAPARNGSPTSWSGTRDDEWQAAAERAAAAESAPPVTGSGLPQRRPGKQMVTPPLRGRRAEAAASADREPEKVRRRLSTYQRGLEAGRHRAADPEEAEERSFQDGTAEGPVPGPSLERYEEDRDPWTGEGLWEDDRRF